VEASDVSLSRFADMRYRRQVNEVEVVAPAGSYGAETVTDLVDGFEREYARIFGEDTGYADAGFTTTGLRLRCTASSGKVSVQPHEVSADEREAALRGTRELQLGGGGERTQVPVYDAAELGPGAQLDGPAIMEFPDTSVIVHPEMRAFVDRFGSVVVEL
jgi:N-methylhydantoinase A